MVALSSETLHASCVALRGKAVLIEGRSGAGKSDLALRLIGRGAQLVSDDYTVVRRDDTSVKAAAPDTIAGKIEARGVGILTLPALRDVPVALVVELSGLVERLPEPGLKRRIAGVDIPAVTLNGFEASADVKIDLLLAQLP